jgi:hypothetical protein
VIAAEIGRKRRTNERSAVDSGGGASYSGLDFLDGLEPTGVMAVSSVIS